MSSEIIASWVCPKYIKVTCFSESFSLMRKKQMYFMILCMSHIVTCCEHLLISLVVSILTNNIIGQCNGRTY